MSRELDEQCGRAFGHTTIEWRVCTTDPESGQWEELQDWAAENKLGEGDVIWTRPAERQPCYNWLDTDGPRQNGWTEARIAEAGRGRYWHVLPFYSSGLVACQLLEDEIERRGLQFEYCSALAACVEFDVRTFSEIGSEYLWRVIRATPEQRCRAFLEAMRVAV